MKKYGILALAFGFIFSLAVSAQDQTPPPVKDGHQKEFKHDKKPKLSAQKRAGYLAVDLELTDAQRAKVQALYEKQDKAHEARQVEVQKLREQEKAKFEADHKANDAEMEKILGTEKFQQFKAKQAEREKKLNEKRDGKEPRNHKGGFDGEKRGPRPEKDAAK